MGAHCTNPVSAQCFHTTVARPSSVGTRQILAAFSSVLCGILKRPWAEPNYWLFTAVTAPCGFLLWFYECAWTGTLDTQNCKDVRMRILMLLVATLIIWKGQMPSKKQNKRKHFKSVLKNVRKCRDELVKKYGDKVKIEVCSRTNYVQHLQATPTLALSPSQIFRFH